MYYSPERQAAATTQVAFNTFRILINIAVIVIAIFTHGIMRTEVSLPNNLVLDTTVEEIETIRFREEYTARHWCLGLVQGEQGNVELALRKYLRSDDKLTNVSVWTRRSAADIVLSVVTIGIYVPVTVHIEGEIIQSHSSEN